MKLNPLNQGRFTTEAADPGPVTREMAYARARELALAAGRLSYEVSQRDYEQAKRELTGESDPDRQDAILDAPKETRRHDTFSSSDRNRISEIVGAVEGEAGRSETDRNRMSQVTRIVEKSP